MSKKNGLTRRMVIVRGAIAGLELTGCTPSKPAPDRSTPRPSSKEPSAHPETKMLNDAIAQYVSDTSTLIQTRSAESIKNKKPHFTTEQAYNGRELQIKVTKTTDKPSTTTEITIDKENRHNETGYPHITLLSVTKTISYDDHRERFTYTFKKAGIERTEDNWDVTYVRDLNADKITIGREDTNPNALEKTFHTDLFSTVPKKGQLQLTSSVFTDLKNDANELIDNIFT